MTRCLILLIAISAILLPSVTQASITINNPSYTYAQVYDGISSQNHIAFGTTIPTSTSLYESLWTNHSNNEIDWSTSEVETILSWNIDHSRSGLNLGTFVQTTGKVLFTPLVDAAYELDGYYDVTDSAMGESGLIHLFGNLIDTTNNSVLFNSYQESRSTHNENFTLGESGGDNFNIFSGGLTGNLIAGHDYSFEFNTYIRAFPDRDSGASALGNVTLKIREAPAAVPEPLSVFVWGCLVVGAVFFQFARANRDSVDSATAS